MPISPITVPDAEAPSTEQLHLEEVLDGGVAMTSVDGQTVTFQDPASIRKRLREKDAQAGGVQRRPLVRQIYLGGF